MRKIPVLLIQEDEHDKQTSNLLPSYVTVEEGGLSMQPVYDCIIQTVFNVEV